MQSMYINTKLLYKTNRNDRTELVTSCMLLNCILYILIYPVYVILIYVCM